MQGSMVPDWGLPRMQIEVDGESVGAVRLAETGHLVKRT